MISYSEKGSLINWTAFEIKSDDPPRDFEALCRSLVRLALGGDGEFIGYKQQSGVEFIVKVNRDNSTLGGKGTVVGWQCKYFRGKSLSSSQFGKIKDSYHKTIRDYKDVVKWILWTPECLSKSDQARIKKLRNKKHAVKEIAFWHADMILALSAILPRTSLLLSYFGRYSFSRKDLDDALEDAIVPILGKWKKEVHCVSSAEKMVRRALFEEKYWGGAWKTAVELAKLKVLLDGCKDIDGLDGLITDIESLQLQYGTLLDAIKDGRIIDVQVADMTLQLDEKISCVLKAAYSKANNAAFLLHNLLHYSRLPGVQVQNIKKLLSEPIIAVKAPPGMGKTHLCISVVSPTEKRPAGFLFLAKGLRKGFTIDEFVRSQSFAGRTFENLDALLNALDSVGRKHGCIMPIVIDGLNESESPGEWIDKIALMRTKIRRNYRNVRVLVTYRCPKSQARISDVRAVPDQTDKVVELDYEKMCLPTGINTIQIEAENLVEMVSRYFTLYNIVFKGRIPNLQNTALQDPLLIRIFCDTNKDKEVVTADFYSAHNVFTSWISAIEGRICDGAGSRGYHSKEEFRKSLNIFAELLWKHRSRCVAADEMDEGMQCRDKDWLYKWSTILADEGVAMRFHASNTGESILEGVHDSVSGFLIAKYLKGTDNDFSNVFSVLENQNHPLASDIISSLVPMWMEMYPSKDIIEVIPKRMLYWAINRILASNKKHCPAATIRSLWRMKVPNSEVPWQKGDILWKSVSQCMSGAKAFNGEVLDLYLTDMNMAERDALWGLWVHGMKELIYEHLKIVFENMDSIGMADVKSVFTCCKWLLSSNVPPIRDLATRLVCAIGEKFPEEVLDLIDDSLSVNDLYILERLVAAGYGICIFLNGSSDSSDKHGLMLRYSKALKDKILKKGARYSTSHYGVLNYAINTVALATNNKTCKVVVYANPFGQGRHVSDGDLQRSKFATIGDLDFVYKDLAHVVGGRDYQTNTSQYKKAYDQVQKRIFALGYRDEQFEKYDRFIRDDRYRSNRQEELFATRFGKKYALIAYMELKGRVDKKIECWDRWHEISIDPTFPDAPQQLPLWKSHPLIKGKFRNMRQWLYGGFSPDIGRLAAGAFMEGSAADFVLINGYMKEEDNFGRRVFVKIDGLLTPAKTLAVVEKHYDSMRIDCPQFYYSFHGESPWSLNWRSAAPEYDQFGIKLKPELVDDNLPKDSKGSNIPVELLTVCYTWESYHSIQNNVGGYLLSAYVAQRLGLRLVPHKWEYVDRDGNLAGRYYSSKDTSRSAELFYLRKDLLEKYTKKRKMIFRIGYRGELQIAYGHYDKHKAVYERWRAGDDMFCGFLDPLVGTHTAPL